MTLNEIVNNAKYIQFPYANESYHDYEKIGNKINKLPILSDENVLYEKMPGNQHHYTTEYTYKYVLPLIDSILGFGFNMDDFNMNELIINTGNLSYITPKKEEQDFTLTCYTDDETVMNVNYKGLFEPVFFENPVYRPLYRYHHRCSRIINNTIDSDRKLMISGDSQMVPSIAPLANYFKEVWYFDNRTGWIRNQKQEFEFLENKFVSFQDNYKDIIFTDIIIELYSRCLEWYEYWNLY